MGCGMGRRMGNQAAERNVMRQAELGWDGIGWDGAGWGGIGWDCSVRMMVAKASITARRQMAFHSRRRAIARIQHSLYRTGRYEHTARTTTRLAHSNATTENGVLYRDPRCVAWGLERPGGGKGSYSVCCEECGYQLLYPRSGRGDKDTRV